MKKFYGFIVSVLLVATSSVYAQGTQISGSQIRDGAITNSKINASAAIDYTKINFTGAPASLLNAENPLTFNTPLSRSGNTVSVVTLPVTVGGIGLTSVTAGRLLFGGSSSQLATHANLTYDSGNNRMFVGGTSGSSTFNVTGTGYFSSDLTIGGTFTINGKLYTWPATYGSAGTVLTDPAGDGVLSWAAASGGGSKITLQSTDPGTPDVGNLNLTGNGYISTGLGFNGKAPVTLHDWGHGNNPVAQLWNTDTIFGDNFGIHSAPTSISWETPDPGYVASFYSSSAAEDGNGLFVKVTSNSDNTRVVDFNVNGNDVFYLTGAGNISMTGGKTYLKDADFSGNVSLVYLKEGVGTPQADASTVTVTAAITHITGTGTAIGTITVPYGGFTGSIILIADDAGGFTTTTGGNIAIGSTVTQNHTLALTYDGTSWYPNY